MLLYKEIILKGRLGGEAKSWSHPGVTPHTSNMAKFCLQPHPGNLISFIRVAMALSGGRIPRRGPHSFLAGAHHLRNWGSPGPWTQGESEISVELHHGHWWSLASPYVLRRGITYFTRNHGAEAECEQKRFQLGEAPLALQEQHSSSAARLLCRAVGVFSRTLESVWQMCITMHSNNWCILKWAAQEGRGETMHLFMHLPIYCCFFAEKQPLIYAHLHKRKRLWRRFFYGSKGSWCPFRALSLSPRYTLLN